MLTGNELNNLGPKHKMLFLYNVVLNTGCNRSKLLLLVCWVVLVMTKISLCLLFSILYINNREKYLCIISNFSNFMDDIKFVTESNLPEKEMHLTILFCPTIIFL